MQCDAYISQLSTIYNWLKIHPVIGNDETLSQLPTARQPLRARKDLGGGRGLFLGTLLAFAWRKAGISLVTAPESEPRFKPGNYQMQAYSSIDNNYY
jgi:hypothetical protein